MTQEPSELALRESLPADRHPAAVYLGRLAPGSRRTMRAALDAIAGFLTGGRADARSLDWSKVRYQHAQAVRRFLAEKYAPATANKMLAALRGTLREAWRLGQMTAEDFHRAADLEAVRGESVPKGRALTAGELAGLFRVCAEDSAPAGARDAALLALLYAGGIRRAEAVALDIDDFDPDAQMLTVRRGKGRKARTLYVNDGALDAIREWLKARGPKPGPLFLPLNKAGRAEIRQLSEQSVYNILVKRGEQAGLPHFSPHDLRRSFVSDLIDSGADLSTIQKLVGHASIVTTQKYDRRGEEAKKKAARLLFVPYTRPRRKR